MDRVKKLKLNASVSLINRFTILISGMILPRLILVHYGSEVNGLTSSINQFLSIITFLDMGVGAVVQSALFKPLALDDRDRINLILKSAAKYFRKIAYFLVIYIAFLILFYPQLVGRNIDPIATGFLIIAMSINRFAQYYFGIVNELLLNSDQKSYVQLTSEIVTVVLNTVISVLLISNGYSIVIVKLLGGLVFLFRPLYLKYYVNKNYDIDYNVEVIEEPLEQKWNGVAQHVASVVLNSTDTIVLTAFSSLENVSIYAVYNMVVHGIKLIVTSLVTGIQSFFGNLLANDETDLLNSYFERIEWLVHTAVTYLFGLTAVLIVPFVMLYTQGIEDANYNTPTFALILVIAQATYCIRLPYNSMVLAAGHYRQTQSSAIIEVIINVLVSVISVQQFGLIGIAIGTLMAMAYRSVYLAWYLEHNIIYRPLKNFMKHLLVDIITFIIFMSSISLVDYGITSYINWITTALVLAVVFLIVVGVINFIAYKEVTSYYVKNLLKILK